MQSWRVRRGWKRVMGSGLAAVVVATGLSAVAAAPGAAAATSTKCPVNAAKSAKSKPVEITFWHSMNRANETRCSSSPTSSTRRRAT